MLIVMLKMTYVFKHNKINVSLNLEVCLPKYGSRGSSVSVVSDYRLDDQAIEVRSPAEAKRFFL
jgi:hypothetical protein